MKLSFQAALFAYYHKIHMSFFTITILALGMSVDAFAAALARGAAQPNSSLKTIIKTALIFGAIETIAPTIGWLVGKAAVPFFEQYKHWLAFFMLLILGGKMIHNGIFPTTQAHETLPQNHGFWLTVSTAIATSMDSLIVGMGLAFLHVNIVITALAIGTATTIMSALGLFFGRILGIAMGMRAEILGGIVLVSMGIFILIEHIGLIQ